PMNTLGGKGSAIEEAAQRFCNSGEVHSRKGFRSRLDAAKFHYGLEPDESLYVPETYTYVQRVQKETYAPPTPYHQVKDSAPRSERPVKMGEIEHIMVIPDRHRDPRYPHRLECDTWIAQEGSARRPKYVVDLGDTLTMDSCSRHDKKDTKRGQLRPTIKQDLDHHVELHQAFERGRAADWKPIKIKCRGNHEERLWDFENQNPEAFGSHTHTYSETLLQFGWKEYPYKQIVYIGGVGFVHAPVNGMGKQMGGKTSSHRAAALLRASLVHGHTHKRGMYDDAKLDPSGPVSVMECGCALPWGEVETYAEGSPIGWWWGIVFLKVCDGAVIDADWVSMATLKERYGQKLAA
ncbi:MAG TPA: hypothetical protein VN039_13675, partial [Nitrospira sp.]|nr:hypothetical protein [Nitrospira sp.]